MQVDLSPAARTELLAEYLDLPGLSFDVSHYNAILKVPDPLTH